MVSAAVTALVMSAGVTMFMFAATVAATGMFAMLVVMVAAVYCGIVVQSSGQKSIDSCIRVACNSAVKQYTLFHKCGLGATAYAAAY